MNNSSDSQALTRNPQADVGGNLQPNISNLQPVTGSSQSQSLDLQTLPRVNSLSVQTSSAGKAAPPETPLPNTTPPIWLFVIVPIVLIGVLLIAARRDREPVESQREVLRDKMIEPSMLVRKKKLNSKTKPKNKKKRKKK